VLIDGRTIPNQHTLDTDVCIVGAGAAGIILAMEFAGRPFRVLLLESGGFDADGDTQSLYQGASVGLPYFPLEASRLRYFGGATNHWSGMCWPWTEDDFRRREWIPHSGWPLTKASIAAFYRRALPVFQLEHDEWRPNVWAEPDEPVLPFAGDRVVTRVTQRAWPGGSRLRFGHAYRERLLQATNITVCLQGNALRFDTNDSGKAVTRLHVASLAGNRFSVTARRFILAAGGIENPRLLLLSNTRRAAGLGNQHGLVGRYFLEHPQFDAGIFRPMNPRLPIRFYQQRRVKGALLSAGLELPEEVRRQEKLVGVSLDFRAVYEETYARAWASTGLSSLRHLVARLRRGTIPDDFGKHLGNIAEDFDDLAVSAYGKVRFGDDYPIDHVRLRATVEPAPNPDSRITLGAELDQLGQRRVTLDWRLSPIDKRSVRRTLELLGMELGRTGLGRLQITLDDSDTSWPADLVGSWHHMGTTRMSHDPKQGVVDEHCRVHGIANLFVAGSSVFPTAGSGTPTLLIGALAIRLADHIKDLMT
jgi:choline dehydrogenase-like flavoprotein